MHIKVAERLIESVRRRDRQGDCPTEPALSVELLEDLVLALADLTTANEPLKLPSREWMLAGLATDPDAVECEVRPATTPSRSAQMDSEPRACKCGDPACQLWRDDRVCPHCEAVLTAICDDPEFEGKSGDMGEGHYADCPHGALDAAGERGRRDNGPGDCC